jgi:RimJ/RimL family protein N-acetyltransferase
MLHIVEIDESNSHYLTTFLVNDIPSTFRYFKTRSINILKNHILTIMLLDDDLPIGYAHIDYENKYWLGICILDTYHGKGHGNRMMEYIFNHEKITVLNDIYLTVDATNENAIKLYKKFNFSIVELTEKLYIMKK